MISLKKVTKILSLGLKELMILIMKFLECRQTIYKRKALLRLNNIFVIIQMKSLPWKEIQ